MPRPTIDTTAISATARGLTLAAALCPTGASSLDQAKLDYQLAAPARIPFLTIGIHLVYTRGVG